MPRNKKRRPKPVPPAVTVSPRRDVGAWRICTNCIANGGDLSWARYVVCQPDSSFLSPIQGQGVKVIAYQDATFAGPSGGLSVAAMSSGWFARVGGASAQSSLFPGNYFADPSSVGYQNAWATAVIAESTGFDGIMLDDVNKNQDLHLDGRVFDAPLDVEATWQAAVTSFLNGVVPQLRAAGFTIILPNIYMDTYWAADSLAVWDSWTDICGAGNLEYWSKWGTAASWHTGLDFSSRTEFLRRTQQAGNTFTCITYGGKTDTRSQTYARAAFLLDYDPNGTSAQFYEPNDPEAQDPYTTTWTQSLGLPLGPKQGTITTGYWRLFEGGTVRLNPTTGTLTIYGESLATATATIDTDSPAVNSTPAASINETVLDDFNRADQGPPPSSNWTTDAWGYGANGHKVESTLCVPSGVNTNYFSRWNPHTYQDANAYVTLAAEPTGGSEITLYVRSHSAGYEGYLVSWVYNSSGTDTVTLRRDTRRTGGALTTLATYSQNLVGGDKIGITAVGSTISAWAYTNNAWAQLGSVTDTTITAAGYIDLYTSGSGVSASPLAIDDFGGGGTPSTSATLSGAAAGSASLTAAGTGSATLSGASPGSLTLTPA